MSIYAKDYKRWLTRNEQKAIDFIGSHRKTRVVIGRHISKRMYNKLRAKHLVMPIYQTNRVMLTLPGEQVWAQMHPYSKYAIKD